MGTPPVKTAQLMRLWFEERRDTKIGTTSGTLNVIPFCSELNFPFTTSDLKKMGRERGRPS